MALPAFSADKVKLKIAGQHPADHDATQALKRIKEQLDKKSGGRIELRIYPTGQLGDYTQVYPVPSGKRHGPGLRKNSANPLWTN